MKKRAKNLAIALLIYSIVPIALAKATDQLALQIIFMAGGSGLLVLMLLRHGKFIISSFSDCIFLLYIGLIIASGIVAFLLPASKIDLWIYGVGLYYIPMLCYYIGRNPAIRTSDLLQAIWITNVVHLIIAIALYRFFPYPSWWLEVLEHINYFLKRGAFDTGFELRMMSLHGCLSFGVLAATTLLLSFRLFWSHPNLRHFLSILLATTGVFFSLQRSSWAAAILLTSAFVALWLDPIARLRLPHQRLRFSFVHLLSYVLLGSMFLFGWILLIPNLRAPSIVEEISYRVNLTQAIQSGLQERGPELLSASWQLFLSYPMGVGIGQLGYIAHRLNISRDYPLITDGNYAKILGELGMLGLSFQLYFLIPALVLLFRVIPARYKNRDHYLTVSVIALIIVQYYMQAIGTNVWDLYYVNVVFWILVGALVKEYNVVIRLG